MQVRRSGFRRKDLVFFAASCMGETQKPVLLKPDEASSAIRLHAFSTADIPTRNRSFKRRGVATKELAAQASAEGEGF
jgi:hypothetical protein